SPVPPPLPLPDALPISSHRSFIAGARVQPRQDHVESRASARLAHHPDRSTALLHDAVDGGQPEPGAFAGLLRGEEWIEEAAADRLEEHTSELQSRENLV